MKSTCTIEKVKIVAGKYKGKEGTTNGVLWASNGYLMKLDNNEEVFVSFDEVERG